MLFWSCFLLLYFLSLLVSPVSFALLLHFPPFPSTCLPQLCLVLMISCLCAYTVRPCVPCLVLVVDGWFLALMVFLNIPCFWFVPVLEFSCKSLFYEIIFTAAVVNQCWVLSPCLCALTMTPKAKGSCRCRRGRERVILNAGVSSSYWAQVLQIWLATAIRLLTLKTTYPLYVTGQGASQGLLFYFKSRKAILW